MTKHSTTTLFALCLGLTACDGPIDSETMNDPFEDAGAAAKGDHIGETFVERGDIETESTRSGLVNNNLWNIYDIEGFQYADFPLLVSAEADSGMEMYMLVFEAGPVEPLMTGRYIGWSGMDTPERPEVQFNLEADTSYRILVRGLYKGDKGRFNITALCGIADAGCEPAWPFE